jgi:hypothetical protein
VVGLRRPVVLEVDGGTHFGANGHPDAAVDANRVCANREFKAR